MTSFALLLAANPAVASRAQAPQDPNALMIFAEVALERGDCKTAAESYAAAVPQGSAALAKRASEVGLACEHLPAAWASAQRWRALAPGDIDAAALYAAVALRLHRIPEAQAAVRTIASGADSERELTELAALLLDEAEAPAVLAALSGAVDTATAPAPTLTLLAQLAFAGYDLYRAAQYSRLALKLNPASFAARSLLARIYAANGDQLNAVAAARAAMQLEPERGRFELAEVLVALDRPDDARRELERLRAAGAAVQEVERRLALLAVGRGDLEEAKRLFGELAAREKDNDAALFHLAEIAALEDDPVTALAGYRRLAHSSVAVGARTRAAGLLLERGNRAEALTLLDEYAIEHPAASFEITLTKANLLAEHGEVDSGLALLSAALERHPRHPALEYDRAVLFERAGEVRKCIEALEQLLEDRPQDPTILNALGYTLADHGMRLAYAESLIRQALAVVPDNPAVIDSLGWVRFKRGDARGAAGILERAYALGRDPQIAAHWGEALWKSGSKPQAREVWSEALARDPDSQELQTVIGRFVKPEKP